MTDISTIKKTITPIARSYGVKRIYLFGSYAKGNATENSDIDLLVEKGKPMSLLKLSGMRQSVQEALDLSVDLVTTAGIEDAFLFMRTNCNKVAVHGSVIISGDPR